MVGTQVNLEIEMKIEICKARLHNEDVKGMTLSNEDSRYAGSVARFGGSCSCAWCVLVSVLEFK